MNNRLVIICVYSRYGNIEDYVCCLIDSFIKISDRVIVALSGETSEHELDKIRKRPVELVQRENLGFDAGAYKDILSELHKSELARYDELVLANDSFYGPFFDLKNVFDKMNTDQTDFWGITAYHGTYEGEVYDMWNCPYHIQSYFLVFRKNVLVSDFFGDFWKELKYADSLDGATINFEIRLSRFLLKKGYKALSYQEIVAPEFNRYRDINLYIQYPIELIERGIPILKRKLLDPSDYKKNEILLKRLAALTSYDLNMIKVDQENRMLQIIRKIKEFIAKYGPIYIYGDGKYGKWIQGLFGEKGWNYEAVMVTRCQTKTEDCVSYKKEYMGDDVGLVLAMGYNATNEVLDMLENDIYREQALCICQMM